ncbi:hypothetical protein DL764_009389 [Monosporascus ibericus]|uniref:Xylanolytic transcriptional activator regulatory domain-containing protein n=1 Tax=Monosporascus ibericus TaxID=155417 RepID=A0A4Q4SV61_9PEZI|nr:hypothetical protein DL764_009389 [Monosporascus ibericus]
MENAITLQDARPTGVLPDRRTADILVDSFFTNVFNKKSFLESMEEWYADPLSVHSSVLCLLYLVFAIGLVLARPVLGSAEEAVISKLRSERVSRAELFYRNARMLADPVSGFEDADFWSVQALLLTSLYMLAVSKRNAAYAYHGMAVRSAFALGLHREESMVIFNETEVRVRKSLWKTLFILDRFLSACLGRPMGISDDDCSEDAFKPPRQSTRSDDSLLNSENEGMGSIALQATVQTCHIIGMTLKKEHHFGASDKPYRLSQRMESFAQICVEASQHTLELAKAALEAEYLPHCNPFAIHFVFTAALIILSNEFASLYHNPDATTAIHNAISILRFCADEDAQAERVLYIVETFHQANVRRPATARRLSIPRRKIPTINTLSHNAHYDPMLRPFHHEASEHLTTIPAIKERPVMGHIVAPSSSIPSMMPPALQQPSPEGSVSLNGGMGAAGSGIPPSSLETLSGGESEFDFDTLWSNWPAPSASTSAGIPIAAPHGMQPSDSGFGSYGGIGQPQVPLGSNPNVNVPLYAPSNYR